ncbi:MAG: hypothetical protein WDZ85_03255 [Candidatus Paceibacterota bacterium]
MIDTNYLKDKLTKEKKVLTDELNKVGVLEPGSDDNWNPAPANRNTPVEFHDEMADRMENIIEQEAAEVPLEKRLKEVNHALQKIETGHFGQCELGNEPIEEERLEANPAARTCKNHLDDENQLPPIND